MNRAWSRYCFAAAAVFLLLSGTVLRLLMGGAVGAEVANLLVPVAVAAVFWMIASHGGREVSELLKKSSGWWYLTTMLAAALVMALLPKTYVMPVAVTVLPVMALLPLRLLTYKRGILGLAGYLLAMVLATAMCYLLGYFAAAVLCVIVYLAVLCCTYKDFDDEKDLWSIILKVLLLIWLLMLGAFLVVDNLHNLQEWLHLLADPFDDIFTVSEDSFWNYIGRSTLPAFEWLGQSALKEIPDGVQGFMLDLTEIFGGAADDRFLLLQAGYRMGWLCVIVVLLAVLALVVGGVGMLRERRGMHFVVTLAAVLTVLLPILFYCGQNLGVETLSIDHCPLLGNDWVKNSVYMLLLCAAWKEPCYLRDFIVYKMEFDEA